MTEDKDMVNKEKKFKMICGVWYSIFGLSCTITNTTTAENNWSVNLVWVKYRAVFLHCKHGNITVDHE